MEFSSTINEASVVKEPQTRSQAKIFTEAVSFWLSELPLREWVLGGSEGMLPQNVFENFIPKSSANAPKFY